MYKIVASKQSNGPTFHIFDAIRTRVASSVGYPTICKFEFGLKNLYRSADEPFEARQFECAESKVISALNTNVKTHFSHTAPGINLIELWKNMPATIVVKKSDTYRVHTNLSGQLSALV